MSDIDFINKYLKDFSSLVVPNPNNDLVNQIIETKNLCFSYDKKNNVKHFTMKIGAKVQFKKYFSKSAKGAKSKIQYYPALSYLVIHRIFRSKQVVILKNPSTNYVYKKKYPFDRIRRFKQMNKQTKHVPRR